MKNKMQQIRVMNGEYKGQMVSNAVFTCFEDCSQDGYMVVNGDRWGKGKVRVRIDAGNFEFLSTGIEHQIAPVAAQNNETDEQTLDRLKARFEILDEMSQAAIAGNIRALILQGPPGIGKSHGVVTQMQKSSMFDDIAGRPPRYEVVKGFMTPISLYCKLYSHSDPGHVLVFDDCDSILEDEESLNVLKAALDSSKSRRVFWGSDSKMLRREGVPDSFDFRGTVIFITNQKLDGGQRDSKRSAHLNALQSRCHFLDLKMNTVRECLIWIKHVVSSGRMLEEYGLNKSQADDIVEFMYANQTQLRELSLRMAVKIADLVKISTNWQNLARATCMRG
jgi:hypothetical protein